jgi:hypothetical protein
MVRPYIAPLAVVGPRRLAGLALLTLAGATGSMGGAGCGDINLREEGMPGAVYCQDLDETYHFEVLVPPWKFNKEYKCTDMEGRECVGSWLPTGRYVFVVSDIPFVNLDSEIVTLLNVEVTSGDTGNKVQQVIIDKDIGQPGSDAVFVDDQEYPRPVELAEPALSGHDVLWRQKRSFEGRSYNWYRRDVFLRGAGSRVYHLQFYSIGSLDKPEFNALLRSFREGPAPDGAPDCPCLDEHDPSGPQEC